ncbi:hypothetical protein AB0J63_26860 [Streptosporangium canum]|uniref:hypothetical protein n=1 Tax=Streptosporangium canum TaxID=324952 RepID=UPI003449C239
MTPPRLYNVHETHTLVRKSVSWLYQESAKGAIPVTRIGRNIFWTDAQITQIITAGAQESKVPAKRPAQKRSAVAPTPAPTPRPGRKQLAPATATNIPQPNFNGSRLYRSTGAV